MYMARVRPPRETKSLVSSGDGAVSTPSHPPILQSEWNELCTGSCRKIPMLIPKVDCSDIQFVRNVNHEVLAENSRIGIQVILITARFETLCSRKS